MPPEKKDVATVVAELTHAFSLMRRIAKMRSEPHSGNGRLELYRLTGHGPTLVSGWILLQGPMVIKRAGWIWILAIQPFAISGFAVASGSQGKTPVEITGVVVRTDGTPIASVEIFIVSDTTSALARGTTRTAADGSFSVVYGNDGPAYLRFRRLGYVRTTLLVGDSFPGGRPLHVVMRDAPVELAAFEVVTSQPEALRSFAERRLTRGTGHFVDRAEIEKLNPTYSSDVLRRFPGALVTASGRIGNRVRLRGCKPGVWVDGVQAIGAELDDVTTPAEIAAMEVYNSWAGIPPEFEDRGGKNCGAIIVWTRER